jgi:hypothetical protein
MHNNSYQFVQSLLVVLFVVVGFYFEFEGEGYLPVEFGYAFLVLVVLEPAEVDGEEVGERFDEAAAFGFDQVAAAIAFELVAAGEAFGFAVVVDAVVEGDVGFGQDEAHVYFLLLAFGDWVV